MPTGLPPKSRPPKTWRDIGRTTYYLGLVSYLHLRLWLATLHVSPNRPAPSSPLAIGEALATMVLALIVSAVITRLLWLSI
jgi:hypothetical protein